MRIINPFLFVLLFIAASTVIGAEKAPAEVIRYLNMQGPVIERQIFHSNESQNQLLVRFCVDENRKGGQTEGGNNPANAHCEAALFIRKSKWMFSDEVSLGQGTIREFKNGTVKAESVTYAPDDPMCCPSIKREVVFTTATGKLATSQNN